MADVQKEGSVFFRIKHPDADWWSNARPYEWGPFGDGKGLNVSVAKTAERTLKVTVQFEYFSHTFTGPVPQPDPDTVSVGLSWKVGDKIKLYVNGRPTGSTRFGPTKH